MPKKEGDELINWIESQSELDYIREAANKTLCDYRIDEKKLSERIIVNTREDLSLGREGNLQKLINIFWVPGKNLRGSQVAGKELDNSLDTTSKVMSISTIWDFVCTLPIFTYILSPLAKGAAGPAGFLLGVIILWASNITGENSTNRVSNNKNKARVSLIAFLILSLAKTAVSGVGIDMILSKNRIIENFANEKIENKSSLEQSALNSYDRKIPDSSNSDALLFAREECNALIEQMKTLDLGKGRQRKAREGMYNRAYAPDGPCTRASNLGEIASQEKSRSINKQNQRTSELEKRISDRETMSNTQFLLTYYRPIYDQYFQGVPIGSDRVVNIKTGNTIDNREIDWKENERGEAVAASMNQFFSKLQNGELSSLGFSIFAFVISIILTSTAGILLYTTGKNPEVKASFTSGLGKKSNALMSTYRDDVYGED